MLQHSALRPDLARATRAVTAFSGALLVCSLAGAPLASQYAATAALGLSMPQLRGAYPHRVLLLVVMITVISTAAFLGGLVAGHLPAAVAGVAVLALLSGLWRHASADYGPALGIDSALLFLLALEGPAHGATAGQMACWTALGGTGAALLQIGLWAFRPQHPLRHAVAEAWVAASDLYLALLPVSRSSTSWTPQQRALREALDRASAALHGVRTGGRSDLIVHLEHMVHQAAHLAMQTTAWRTVEEATRPNEAPRAATMEALLQEMANLARSVAITLVMHRRRNLGATRARVRACRQFVQMLLQEDSTPVSPASSELLLALDGQLAALDEVVGATVEHSAAAHQVPTRLPDLSRRGMPAIAAWLNPVPFLTRPRPVCVAYGRAHHGSGRGVSALRHPTRLLDGLRGHRGLAARLRCHPAARLPARYRHGGGGSTGQRHPPHPLAHLVAGRAHRCHGVCLRLFPEAPLRPGGIFCHDHDRPPHGNAYASASGLHAGATAFQSGWCRPCPARRRLLLAGLGAAPVSRPHGGGHSRRGGLLCGRGCRACHWRGILPGAGSCQATLRAGRGQAAASLQRLLAEPGLLPGEGDRATDLVAHNDRLLRAISVLALRLETCRPGQVTAAESWAAAVTGALERAATTVENKTLPGGEAPTLPEADALETEHALLLVWAETHALLLVAGQPTGSSFSD